MTKDERDYVVKKLRYLIELGVTMDVFENGEMLDIEDVINTLDG